MKKMNSINATVKLCQENNIGLSRSHLLQLAKNGNIPCIRVGQKILVNWDGLMKFLDTNTLLSDDAPKTGIRKISA